MVYTIICKCSIHSKLYALVQAASNIYPTAATTLHHKVAPPKRMRFFQSSGYMRAGTRGLQHSTFPLCIHSLIEKNVSDFVVLDGRPINGSHLPR